MGAMGRASRTGALLGLLGAGGLGIIGACSVERPAATQEPTHEEDGEDSGPASRVDAADGNGNVVGVIDGGASDADASDSGWAPPPPACPSRTFIDETVIAKAGAA